MPRLKLNTAITRNTPKLTVTNRFKPGKYTFRLQVKDDAGNQSEPVDLTVTVVKRGTTRVDTRINERLRDRFRVDGRVDGRRFSTDRIRDGLRRGGG